MASEPSKNQWKTLDRDLKRIVRFENAAQYMSRPYVGFGVSLVFIILAAMFVALLFGQNEGSFVIVAATIFGAYMALNIGANDVANNMGPPSVPMR